MMTVQDRVEGILVGLAAGDRNGGPIRMALRLAESLVALQRFDRADILQRYLAWWNEGGFDSGPVAAQVFSLVSAGISPHDVPARVHEANAGLTAGCNPAHRSAPLAMAACLADDDLAAAAQEEAALTHWHPQAGDVAAATVVLCRALVRGSPWAAALEIAGHGRSPQTIAALLDPARGELSRGGFAPAVLQAAIFFVQTHSSFSDALDAAIAHAGPANYCPVLVGVIGGVRWGAASIEPRQFQHCDLLAQVRQRAQELAQPWAL
ncbi:MAG: ADP-ribosylglycohydrolase family protein [Roseiflexaceae bacterium]